MPKPSSKPAPSLSSWNWLKPTSPPRSPRCSASRRSASAPARSATARSWSPTTSSAFSPGSPPSSSSRTATWRNKSAPLPPPSSRTRSGQAAPSSSKLQLRLDVARELPYPPELRIALREQIIAGDLAQLIELPEHRLLQIGDGRRVVLVRAAERLGNDAVDELEIEQIPRRELKRRRGFGRMLAMLPQDR